MKIADERPLRPAANRRNYLRTKNLEPTAESRNALCFWLIFLCLEQFSQPRVPRSANRELCAVAQDGNTAVGHPHFDARQTRQIQHIPPVDPHKGRGVELSLELAERLLLEVGPSSAPDCDVIVPRSNRLS